MGAWANGASGSGAEKPTTEGTLTPLGYAQHTSLGTAILLSATPAAGVALPAGARLAVISCTAQAVRWRDDGTAPTATVGMPLAVGVQFTYSGDLSAIKFIEQASGAVLNVSFYK